MIGLSGSTVYPRNDGCMSRKLGALTYEAKLYYSAFIDKLDKEGGIAFNAANMRPGITYICIGNVKIK